MITRRGFTGGLIAAGVSSVAEGRSAASVEPPPETTALTLPVFQPLSICWAPVYVAEDFLKREGFSDVKYVKTGRGEGVEKALASGEVHISMGFAARHVIRVDAGEPIVFLAGVHVGCFELFGTDRVRAIRDLKGKTVGVVALRSGAHVFLSAMLAHVGPDPRTDVTWDTRPTAEAIELLAQGKIDAFMAVPPEPQELRARKIGHVVVNTMMERPWSQYYCCMVAANREFVRKHPVATKRALRAILSATDFCAREPDRVARLLVDRGYMQRDALTYGLEALREIPYDKWREYEPEDSIRFYALRLHEAGFVRGTPQKIIAQGTDWRFLKELKRELKG